MGAADTVPGVSGGTIAFVSNIYEELILSIQRCNVQALRILFSQGFKAAWTYINGNFLLTLFAGIVFAALLLARAVTFLLENYEHQVMAFFIGLILASSLFLRKQIKTWPVLRACWLVLGLLAAIVINFLPQGADHTALWFIFCSGAIAICAMILPGISGAFILVLLGSYETVLRALRELDFSLLLVFVAGCAIGLISFSNLLAYLLRVHHENTMAFLLGILLGSIYGLLPQDYFQQQVSVSSWTLFGVLTMIGFAIVYALEVFSIKRG